MKRGLAAGWVPLSALALACPATAQTVAVDIPAGPLGQAVDLLAHQTGASVVLADTRLWICPLPALHGVMTVSAAVRRLALGCGCTAEPFGASAWRLSPRRVRHRPPAAATQVPSPTPAPARTEDVLVLGSKRAVPLASFAGSAEVVALPPVGIEAGSAAIVARSTLLSSTYRGAGREKLFVGAIADSSFAGRRQSVTGLYLGDVRLTYGSADPDLLLYDVGSIEILPGPQGAVYGSGSIGGIIRVTPRAPLRDRAIAMAEAGVSTTAQGMPGQDSHAIVNLPLADDLAVRGVVYARREGGFIDRPAIGRDVNRTTIAGGRFAARWWAAPGWTVDATLIGQAIRNRDAQYASMDAPPLTDLGTIPEPTRSDYQAANIVVTGRVGGVSLVSATAVSRQQASERSQFQLMPFATDLRRREDMVSHETRLSRPGENGWVAGVAYARSRGANDYASQIPPAFGLRLRDRIEELALFADGSIRIAPFASVGAGMRAVWSTARTDQRYDGAFAATVMQPDRHEAWLLPSVSASTTPVAGWTAYLRYQQGRRADVSPRNYAELSGPAPHEVIRTLDAGVRWSGRDWQAAGSVQTSHWSGLRIDSLENISGLLTIGLGDWSLLSATAKVAGAVGHGIRIEAAATFNRSRRTASPTYFGRPSLPDIPDVILRGEATWRRRLRGGLVFGASLWARYNGSSASVFGPLRLGDQGDFLLNGLTVDLARDHDGVTVSAENLANARGQRFLLGTVGRDTITPLRPRTIRVAYRRRM